MGDSCKRLLEEKNCMQHKKKKMLQSYRAPVVQLVEHTREVVSSTPADQHSGSLNN